MACLAVGHDDAGRVHTGRFEGQLHLLDRITAGRAGQYLGIVVQVRRVLAQRHRGQETDAKLSYSDTHGWYSSLGATAEEAFDKVRGHIQQLAALAANGDLDGIEAFEHLGEATKWKIAFHYQNRQAPVIVDIFKRAPLAVFAGGTASQSMASLQQVALAKRPEGLGILEFGGRWGGMEP